MLMASTQLAHASSGLLDNTAPARGLSGLAVVESDGLAARSVSNAQGLQTGLTGRNVSQQQHQYSPSAHRSVPTKHASMLQTGTGGAFALPHLLQQQGMMGQQPHQLGGSSGDALQGTLQRKRSVGRSISSLLKGLFAKGKASEEGSLTDAQASAQPQAPFGSSISKPGTGTATPGTPSATSTPKKDTFSLKAVFGNPSPTLSPEQLPGPPTPGQHSQVHLTNRSHLAALGGVQASSKSSTAALENEVQAAMRRAASITGRQHAPSTLLTVAKDLPPKMARSVWNLRDYAVVEKMYTGYASNVYKAFCKYSGETVCLKSYTLGNLCELNRFQIFREVKLHSSLSHDHIIKLFGAFQQSDQVVLVQEFADAGDLFTLLHRYGGRLPERTAVELVMYPFLTVIHYLHSSGIAHRDIKPENILFTADMRLKLCDFGLAINMRDERAVTRAGTLEYMAPEVLNCPFKNKPEENKDNHQLHYSYHVDTWAAGVLTYELLVGLPPFSDKQRATVEDKIRMEMPRFPNKMSELARDFILHCLEKDPLERPNIIDMVNHRWIRTLRRSVSVRHFPIDRSATSTSATGSVADGGSGSAAAQTAHESIPEGEEEGHSNSRPGLANGNHSHYASGLPSTPTQHHKSGMASAKSFTAGVMHKGGFDMSSLDAGMAKLMAREAQLTARREAAHHNTAAAVLT